jgi:hypothetical protein
MYLFCFCIHIIDLQRWTSRRQTASRNFTVRPEVLVRELRHSHKEWAMWQHDAGRIDFDEPLLQLLERGWRFRECSPIGGVRDGRRWGVTGIRCWARVHVDRCVRRDAWAEAVRLALRTTMKCKTYLDAPLSGTIRGSPDDPTVRDLERIRLSAMGWSFSEHLTAQESGRVGWVVSGTRGERQIRAMDDDCSDAWGTALILAAVMTTAASGELCGVATLRPAKPAVDLAGL